MIEFKNVTKTFDSLRVLTNVSCKIHDKKTTVILGPSGVGKSVFIKLLIGLLKPDSGQIFIDGVDVTSLTLDEIYKIRRKFGMLFQDGALFDSITVGENVAFPLKHHTKLSESEIKKTAQSKLELVGLPNVFNKMPSELSGGMRKRASLARAIVLEPQILLFDEPNSGLDPLTSDSIDSLILDMKSKLEITFIVISHDIVGAFNIADYIGMLYNTELVVFGTKVEFKNSSNKVVQNFLKRNLKSIMCEGDL